MNSEDLSGTQLGEPAMSKATVPPEEDEPLMLRIPAGWTARMAQIMKKNGHRTKASYVRELLRGSFEANGV